MFPAEHPGGKDASPAISLGQLAGTWKNAKSGANVRIEQGASGWEVWFSTNGEARITLPEKNRPAIKVDGRNSTCWYSVTLPTPQTMKWDLTQGRPETQCLTGVFTRLGPAPREVEHTAPATPEAKQAVKGDPAPVNPPPEVKRRPRAEAEIAPVPVSRARPVWAPARRSGIMRPFTGGRRPGSGCAITVGAPRCGGGMASAAVDHIAIFTIGIAGTSSSSRVAAAADLKGAAGSVSEASSS